MEKVLIASIVISTRNRVDLLRETVETILPQLGEGFELIIVNDASTDSTRCYLDALVNQRVRIFHRNAPCGLTKNLNYGVEKADGEFIVRIDDDDYMLSNRLERQVQFMRESGADMSWCLARFMDAEGVTISKQKKWGEQYVLENLTKRNLIAHVCVAFRKESFSLVGGYNVEFRMGQDWELWKRMRAAGFKIRMQEEYLSVFRINKKSISTARLGIAENNSGYRTNLIKVCLSNDDVFGALRLIFKYRLIHLLPYTFARALLGQRFLNRIKDIRADA